MRDYLIDIQKSTRELSQKVIRSTANRRHSHLSFFPRHGFSDSLFLCVVNQDWNGYENIGRALQEGATGIVLEQSQEHLLSQVPKNIDVYIIEDSRMFLKNLSEQARTAFQGPVLAVTGSTGKTRTCELLHALLKNKYHVQFNADNRNGFFGICELLINLTPECNFVLAEVGAKIHGELLALGQILQPQAVAITNIQHSHLQTLHNREGVLKLKQELVHGDWVKTVFRNSQDEWASHITDNEPAGRKTVFFEHKNSLDSHDLSLVRILAQHFDVVDETALTAAAGRPSAFGRQFTTLPSGHKLLIDGRISTPESLESLRQLSLQLDLKPRLVILSGAIELGLHEKYFMAEAGLLWSALHAEKIYFTGPSSEAFVAAYKNANGAAAVFVVDESAEKISEAIFALPPNSEIIVQGNLKNWFYELWARLGLKNPSVT